MLTASPRSDRGVILIVTAIALTVLMMLCMFVVDMGVLWLARGQAQNAADAGAHAGAVAIEYDDAGNLTSSGLAYQSAVAAAASNPFIGSSMTTRVDVAADTGTWAHAAPAACAVGGCVQVDVSSTTVPTWFARISGVNAQTVQATATAQVVAANSTGCMRPWFIIDKYTDTNGNGQFDPGEYTPPGYRIPQDLGVTVLFHDNISPSGYGQIDVGSGASAIGDAIRECAGGSFHIGQQVDTKPGANVGQVRMAVQDVISWDPSAYWDATRKVVVGGCAPRCTCPGNPGSVCPYGGLISPRIVQAAICSPTEASCAAGGPSNSHVTITNILSFFILDYDSGMRTISAVLINSAGNIVSGPSAPGGASFLRTVQLIR